MSHVYKLDSLTFVDQNDDGVYQAGVDTIKDKDGKTLLPDSEEVKEFMDKYCLPQIDGLQVQLLVNKLTWSGKFDVGALCLCSDKLLYGELVPKQREHKQNGVISEWPFFAIRSPSIRF